MSNPDINTVRDELFDQLQPIVVGATRAATFKPFPTIATSEASPLSMLAVMSTLPQPGATVEDSAYYDFALITAARCEKGQDATWEAAEDRLNSIESAVAAAISNRTLDSEHWAKVIYRQPSTRPPAPPEFPYWRWSEIYLRVLLH